MMSLFLQINQLQINDQLPYADTQSWFGSWQTYLDSGFLLLWKTFSSICQLTFIGIPVGELGAFHCDVSTRIGSSDYEAEEESVNQSRGSGIKQIPVNSETVEWCLLGARGWGKREDVKEYTLSVIRWMGSGNLMSSMVTIVNDTVLNTWKSLREQIRNVITTYTKRGNQVRCWGAN